MAKGLKVVAIRHPMPQGEIAAQKVQRYAELPDTGRAYFGTRCLGSGQDYQSIDKNLK